MASSEQKRLFVGNLPPDIQEHEIKTEFSYYGPVNKVELKQKKATDSDEVQSSFAFITIAIDEGTLRQCLQEFKAQQFHGRYLQVTVARENFLEKLKREREEAAQFKKPSTSQSRDNDSDAVNAVLPTMSTGDSDESDESSSDESSEDESANQNASVAKQNGVKKFKSSSESSDSEHEQDKDNLVLRKKSKIFLENGKIKIDRAVSTGEAIHVIETKSQKRNKKELDDKSKLADQKRLDSMKKMKNSYNEQKQAIKKALAGVDAAKKSNKIVFDNDDDDEEPSRSNQTAKKSSESKQNDVKTPGKKPKLFDENDSDAEQDFQGNFEIKKQFEGERGEKLRRLQDRFQGDNRFKMDSRFLENDDSDGDGEHGQVNQQHAEKKSNEESTENIETNESDERQWQMNILESVMGKRIQGTFKSKETQKKAAPSMLRFDPTRAEHTKFVEPKVKKRKAKAHSEPDIKRQKIDADNHDEEQPMELANDEPPVSMEHFYEVRGDLKKSLGSGGFSLLSMFNKPADDDDGDSAETAVAPPVKPYEEKAISKNGVKFLADFDPFKCDSSGDEADDNKSKSVPQKIDTDAKKSDIKYESFFQLSSTDERVSEGLSMFKPAEGAENENTDANEYDDAKRQELKNIVKRKMKKSLQNALPRNVKPNKRFKRFAKNL